jgi:hypothetical protein
MLTARYCIKVAKLEQQTGPFGSFHDEPITPQSLYSNGSASSKKKKGQPKEKVYHIRLDYNARKE